MSPPSAATLSRPVSPSQQVPLLHSKEEIEPEFMEDLRSANSRKVVSLARQQAAKILRGEDDRLIVIVGPCSIHDPRSALEYAKLLKPVADQISGEVLVIMRAYFEKPRTT
ncbi:hypothetical protein BGZ92_007091, partial [Podila epicladia]